MITRETIKPGYRPLNLSWNNDALICYGNATKYYPVHEHMTYAYGSMFDRAITSADGKYIFIFTSLATKGLLLRAPNQLIREINRPYYLAETHEYPAAFYTTGDRTYLIHCPAKYCRLDFEDVETGEIITHHPDRTPQDFCHSRLEISPDGTYLISKG